MSNHESTEQGMLRGRTALVTGSTSGIGEGIARALAGQGASIMLHGLGDASEIERLRARLASQMNVKVGYYHADLSRADAAGELVRHTEREFGGVDILVNNAGIQFVSRIEEFPPENWNEIQNVILNASFHAIRESVPGMRTRGWGRIINLVSAHGLVASPFKSAYVAAKHGQMGLTRCVALELAEAGITCNAICPGYVKTLLVERQIESQANIHKMSRDQVIRDVILASQPNKRFIEVEEIAALAVFLCTEGARSITGAAIPIDGGWTAR